MPAHPLAAVIGPGLGEGETAVGPYAERATTRISTQFSPNLSWDLALSIKKNHHLLFVTMYSMDCTVYFPPLGESVIDLKPSSRDEITTTSPDGI